MSVTFILFTINLSLLILHEMDAIRAKEWKMFIVLKDMKEKTAYLIFALAHLPLYIWVILLIPRLVMGECIALYLGVNLFLVFHTIIHFLFRKKLDNGFTSVYSNLLIYSMGALAVIDLLLLL